jgi:hypothetical protein
MTRSKLRIAKVQARLVKCANADGLSPDDIERVKRSGEAAVAFARRAFKVRASRKRRYC